MSQNSSSAVTALKREVSLIEEATAEDENADESPAKTDTKPPLRTLTILEGKRDSEPSGIIEEVRYGPDFCRT